jgi:hypothetical protein
MRWSAPGSTCPLNNSPTRNGVPRSAFRRKWPSRPNPQLARDILAGMAADKTMPPWAAGDEVYGRSGELRTFLEDNGIGYVMRVGRAFGVELTADRRMRADAVVACHLDSPKRGRKRGPKRWQICSVTGSKGERAYAWGWAATASPRHFLLVRKH